MKNSLIVLGILCSTYMGYSQKLIKAVNLEEVTISPILNHSYRNVVYVEATPDFVKQQPMMSVKTRNTIKAHPHT